MGMRRHLHAREFNLSTRFRTDLTRKLTYLKVETRRSNAEPGEPSRSNRTNSVGGAGCADQPHLGEPVEPVSPTCTRHGGCPPAKRTRCTTSDASRGTARS